MGGRLLACPKNAPQKIQSVPSKRSECSEMWFRNRKFVDFALQSAFLFCVIGLVVSAFVVGRNNMEVQGLTGDFGFLERSTGWDISFTLLDYSTRDSYSRALSIGLLNTLFLGVVSLIFGTVIGLSVASARLSRNKLLSSLGGAYVDTFRNIPLILQGLFWYAVLTNLPRAKQAMSPIDGVFLSNRGFYFPGLNVTGGSAAVAIAVIVVFVGVALWVASARKTARWPDQKRRRVWASVLAVGAVITALVLSVGRIPDTSIFSVPYLKGFNLRDGVRLSPELLAGILTISLYGAAFIAEIFRAGLLSISQGMGEAGAALGLRAYQVFFRIRLPLAIRAVLPTLTNQYIWLMKATTIGIAIGFADFFMVVAVSISQAGQTMNLLLLLFLGFWLLNLAVSVVANWIDKKIALKGTQNR